MHTNGGRERAYRELRESEELHRATLSSISDAVFVTDDDGAFKFICPNVDVLFGYVPDEVRTFDLISGLLGASLFDHAQLKALGEIRNIEREVVTKSGERRTVLIHVKNVSIGGGTQLYCCRDITDLRQAEEQLRETRAELAHASRLALVGELMASITHEVRQPLTAIIGNASAGRLVVDKDPELGVSDLREIFEDIIAEGRLAADIIDRLRTLASKRPLSLETLDVNELVTDTLRLIRFDARQRHVALRAELERTLPAVQADRVCLQHVLLSLALNAIDSMEHLSEEERSVLLTTTQRNGSVELSVTDVGPGIAPENVPKVFDAFFTTKKDGLGLGLAIAQSIVQAHGGQITAESVHGRGATFRVILPLTASPGANAVVTPAQ